MSDAIAARTTGRIRIEVRGSDCVRLAVRGEDGGLLFHVDLNTLQSAELASGLLKASANALSLSVPPDAPDGIETVVEGGESDG